MTTRSIRSERHALQELNEAIAALTFNQRGEITTSEWLTPSEREIVGKALDTLIAVRDRVHSNYLKDDPR
jgi:hypothetical protein